MKKKQQNLMDNEYERNKINNSATYHSIVDKVDQKINNSSSANIVIDSIQQPGLSFKVALEMAKFWHKIKINVLIINFTDKAFLGDESMKTYGQVEIGGRSFVIRKSEAKSIFVLNDDLSLKSSNFDDVQVVRTIVSKMKNEFNRILICTASTNKSFDNIISLSVSSYGLLLVVQRNVTGRKMLKKMVRLTHETVGRILGTIWID
ncbi:hypothetical protein CJP55_04045 [Lactobacillus plantarum]|nr:hypothetical protein [Lactiplantibacillus plantarum]